MKKKNFKLCKIENFAKKKKNWRDNKLTNWREKMPSRPENSSGILRNGRLIRWRLKITPVYCCCECPTLIQRHWSIPTSHPIVYVLFTKARQKLVVSRRTFLEQLSQGNSAWFAQRNSLFRLVLFSGFNSSTIRTACSSPEKSHCSLHETCIQV